MVVVGAVVLHSVITAALVALFPDAVVVSVVVPVAGAIVTMRCRRCGPSRCVNVVAQCIHS